MTAPAPAAAPAQSTVTLVGLCEPLFLYVCRLNRASRLGQPAGSPSPSQASGPASFSSGGSALDTGVFVKRPAGGRAPAGGGGGGGGGGAARRGAAGAYSLDYQVVRAEVKALIEDVAGRAGGDYRLGQLARDIELPLMFFVDAMISESKLPFAAEWNNNRLAYERNELAGDEAFFDMVEATLKDNSPDATEKLAVYYVCLGLGFTGIHFRQPEYLRKTMLAIAPRVRHLVDTDLTAKICPESYAAVDTRDLRKPPSNKLVIVAILFLCFFVAAVVAYVLMYREASEGITGALNRILPQDPAK